MFQKIVTRLIYICCLVILGYTLGVYFGKPGKPSGLYPEIDSTLVITMQHKIDSLEILVEGFDSLSNILKDSIREVEVMQIIEVNAVKKLPLDSGVLYLRKKLREFQDE